MPKLNSAYPVGRIPPHNVEAEISCLGGLLLDRDALLKVVDILQPEDFYRSDYGTMYGCMLSLFEKNAPVDIVTLSEELSRIKKLEEVGGQAAISQLVSAVATASNVAHYALIIREKALLRRLIHAAADIGDMAFEEDVPSNTILDRAEQALFNVTQRFIKQNFIPATSIVTSVWERLNELSKHDGSMRGVPTGFKQLDSMLGGLQRSDLVILAARPAMGKTAFALNIARHAAIEKGKVVAIISLEMSRDQLMNRLISSVGRIDSWKLQNAKMNEDDFRKLNEAAGQLSEASIFIDDSPTANIMEVRAKVRRLQMDQKKLDLVIIDYLQLMEGSSRGHSDNRVQEVSEISRSLKALAREMDCPVVALSQLSRAVESRPDKRPMLSDLRESGSIEQDADVVIFLNRDYYQQNEDEKNILEVLVRKHRNGPTGEVRLLAQLQYSRFENLVENPGQP
jgi:replicative DNA helicase